MAEWLCRGLQILVYRFDSGFGLQSLFRDSSAVEQSAVNRLVVGSNPTRGAKKKKDLPFQAGFFYKSVYRATIIFRLPCRGRQIFIKKDLLPQTAC